MYQICVFVYHKIKRRKSQQQKKHVKKCKEREIMETNVFWWSVLKDSLVVVDVDVVVVVVVVVVDVVVTVNHFLITFHISFFQMCTINYGFCFFIDEENFWLVYFCFDCRFNINWWNLLKFFLLKWFQCL